MLRPASPSETPALIELAHSTGIFEPHEAEALLKPGLDDLHAGRLDEGHVAQVWARSKQGPPLGWVYFSPERHSTGVWQLWWIGVLPAEHGQGIGSDLLDFVELTVKAREGRLLVVETSSLPSFTGTRQFYSKKGYVECGRINEFYSKNEDKVIFAKKFV